MPSAGGNHGAEMKSPLIRRILLGLVLLAILTITVRPAIRYYRFYMSHVTTEDAYVDGTVGLVAARISGTVTRVYVDDNWVVKGGQLLVELDPRDYQVQVDELKARVDHARQTVDQLFAQVDSARSGLKLAESELKQAQIDYDRARTLRQQNVVSREYYDQAFTALRVAEAEKALAQHQVDEEVPEDQEERDDRARYDRPIVGQAQADLEAARLDLSYTHIHAPFEGIVTRKNVHLGDRIQAGQPLLAIVPIKSLYITANYKETELTNVRVGQQALIWADIYPGYVYHGHVDSISMGTGAAFALLPPENATGNWVKVVQRVPVKIVLNSPPPADKPLRIGLSVEVAVDITDTSGQLLTSALQQRYERQPDNRPWENLQSLQPGGTRSTPDEAQRPLLSPQH
jgi:membrane fusion protein (multidrug efflux system)